MDWWMFARLLKVLAGICLVGAFVYGIISATKSKTKRRLKRLEEQERQRRETLQRVDEILKERAARESSKPNN